MGRGERTTANRSAATPAWKPQRICKGKMDAMQAKSITGGRVREGEEAHVVVVSLTCFVFIFFFSPPLVTGVIVQSCIF